MRGAGILQVNKDEDHDDDEGGSNLRSEKRGSWSKAVQVSWAETRLEAPHFHKTQDNEMKEPLLSLSLSLSTCEKEHPEKEIVCAMSTERREEKLIFSETFH